MAADSQKGELTLQQLITKLHQLFENDHVNVEEVQQAMESYQPVHNEWMKYAQFDPHRYTRNLVDSGNGKFNLILLCWGEGHGSGVHDHADAHCWMKVIDGAVCEKLYDWPDANEATAADNEATSITIKNADSNSLLMTPRRITEYNVGEVAYINDTIGLHRIENNSHTESAITLHLYSPAFDMCRSFDERTGRSTNCKVTFWSKYGERTPFKTSSKKNVSSEQN